MSDRWIDGLGIIIAIAVVAVVFTYTPMLEWISDVSAYLAGEEEVIEEVVSVDVELLNDKADMILKEWALIEQHNTSLQEQIFELQEENMDLAKMVQDLQIHRVRHTKFISLLEARIMVLEEQ